MNLKKLSEKLETALDHAITHERKIRLNYLLARLYSRIREEGAVLYHFSEAQDLLEYTGENGLIGFKDFYRYRQRLENVESKIEFMLVDSYVKA